MNPRISKIYTPTPLPCGWASAILNATYAIRASILKCRVADMIGEHDDIATCGKTAAPNGEGVPCAELGVCYIRTRYRQTISEELPTD